jgi:hypothetical protein
MGERKVINKYYPPDFDPSLIPRAKKPKNDQQTVRMMLPMSVRCRTCGEYLYRGKKFNAKKETVLGEEYLGIKIFRFYMKCTRCKGEFTIKTDPERADYVAELNVSRNFEPWRKQEEQLEEAKETRKQEEEGDVMKQLENRTIDSKVEMDILDALADIKSLNTRNARLDLDQVIEEKIKEAERKELEEEENLVKSLFRGQPVIKRLSDQDEEEGDPLASLPAPLAVGAAPLAPTQTRGALGKADPQKKRKALPFPIIIKASPKKQKEEVKTEKEEAATTTTTTTTESAEDSEAGGLVDY